MTTRLRIFVLLITFSTISIFTYAGAQEDLLTSVRKMDKAGVEKAIASGADVNFKDASGNTALCNAYFSPEITQLLIDKGADVNAGAYPPLYGASIVGSVEVIKILLANNADVHKQAAKQTPIVGAIMMTNSIECMDLLIKKGANVNDKFGHYTNLICIFSSYGMTQTERKAYMTQYAKMLEKYGLIIPEWYSNPSESIIQSPQEIIKFLVDKGADINKLSNNIINPGKNGNTPLFTAMNVGKKEIIFALLKNGADYNTTSNQVLTKGLTLWDLDGEYSALMYAVVKGYTDVVKWICKQPNVKYHSISANSFNEKMLLRLNKLSAIYLALFEDNNEMVIALANSSIKWEDFIIKAMKGQKFESSYKSKPNKYALAYNKKNALHYNPSGLADFLGNKQMKKFLESKGM